MCPGKHKVKQFIYNSFVGPDDAVTVFDSVSAGYCAGASQENTLERHGRANDSVIDHIRSTKNMIERAAIVKSIQKITDWF
jgi:hypothetical protein